MNHVLQGDAIKTAIESHRRQMPYNMGTLFWQHNDCWPVASWASRDYYGRWKAQHYYVRKAYDDILISSVVEGDDLIVYAVSDRLENTSGRCSSRSASSTEPWFITGTSLSASPVMTAVSVFPHRLPSCWRGQIEERYMSA